MSEHDTPVLPLPREAVLAGLLNDLGTRMDANEAMRQRSGNVTGGPLASLLYMLIRDGTVSPSRLEQLLDDLCTRPVTGRFTNGWLGDYANDVARRLLEAEVKSAPALEPSVSPDGEYVEKSSP